MTKRICTSSPPCDAAIDGERTMEREIIVLRRCTECGHVEGRIRDDDRLLEALARFASFHSDEQSMEAALRAGVGGEYYEEGDGDAPLLSEAFLYALFGKEDARTLLARWREVLHAAGFDVVDMRFAVIKSRDDEADDD